MISNYKSRCSKKKEKEKKKFVLLLLVLTVAATAEDQFPLYTYLHK